MTGVLFGMGAALLALCVVVAYLAGRILELQEDQSADHAKCIAHIADTTSKRVVALALRDLSVRWESVEEKANLIRLSREVYKAGGPSMPSIWLDQQADLLDPQNRKASA